MKNKNVLYVIGTLLMIVLFTVNPAGASLPAESGNYYCEFNNFGGFACEPLAPTPTDAPTDTPQPTDTPETPDIPAEAYSCHEPGAHIGESGQMTTKHEHGDCEPPQVIKDFIADNAQRLGFDEFTFAGNWNTPGENLNKHVFYKVYHTFFRGGEQFVIIHMGTGVPNIRSIFHSAQIYMVDLSDNVTYVRGWVDYAQGNPFSPTSATRNFFQSASCVNFNDGFQPAGRPRMIVNCGEQANPFESWYNDFHGVVGELGFTVHDTYSADGDPSDASTWTPYGNYGLGRHIDMVWRKGNKPNGWFVSDQFGRLMSGMNDARCGTAVVVHGQTHPVKCLWQYVSATAIDIVFPGNSVQTDYPGAGIVELPN